MKLSPKNMLFVAIGAVVLVIALVTALLVVPQVRRLGTLDAEQEEANRQNQAAQTLLDQLFSLRDRAALTDAQIIQLATAFPQDPELTGLIIELQDVAYEQEVALRRVEPGDLAPRENFVALPIEMVVWGEWQQTVSFLQSLQRLSRQVRVVQIESQVIPYTDIEEATELDVQPYPVETIVRFEAYVIPSQEAAPADPAAPVDPAAAPN